MKILHKLYNNLNTALKLIFCSIQIYHKLASQKIPFLFIELNLQQFTLLRSKIITKIMH